MVLSTVLNLFFIPVLYVILKTFLARFAKTKVVKPGQEAPGQTAH
jgi:HAE1 family hydrophobic/amphiphilic exporter-1